MVGAPGVHLLVADAASEWRGGSREAPSYRLAGSWSIDEAAAATEADGPRDATPSPAADVGFVTMAIGEQAPSEGRSQATPMVAAADTDGRVALLCLDAPLLPQPAGAEPRGRPRATFTYVHPSTSAHPVTALAFDGSGQRLAVATAAHRVHVYNVTPGDLTETPWSVAFSAAMPLQRVVPERRSLAMPPFAIVWPGGGAGANTLLVSAHDFTAVLAMDADPQPPLPPLALGAGPVKPLRPTKYAAHRVVVRAADVKTGVPKDARVWRVPGGHVLVLGPFSNVLGVGALGPGGEVAVVERPSSTLTEYLPAVLPKRSLT